MAQNIRKAIAAHGQWKMKLKEAIQRGAGELNPGKVARPDQCEFGQWLRTLPAAVRYSTYGQEVEATHAEFHRAAADVIHHVLEKQTELARLAMERGPFATSSAHLTLLLTQWERELDQQGIAA